MGTDVSTPFKSLLRVTFGKVCCDSVAVDLFIVTPIVGVCNCCTLLYVHSSIAIILMGKRELVALLNYMSRYG